MDSTQGSSLIKTTEELPFRFKVSGNIIRKLGRESISNQNVAILELIKNAYDAKATKVVIQLNGVDTQQGQISISDNGHGMTNTDLENKWMTIGNPHKSKIMNFKPSERIITGEKGIGRLSAESLGRKTHLITRPINETSGYRVLFDWEEYQKDNVLCNEVINKGYKFEKSKSSHGTTIEITELNHNWNESLARKELLRDIYLLHPPNKSPKDFRVVPEFRKHVKDLKKINRNFLDKASYYMKARLIDGNRIQYEFKTITGGNKKDTIQIDRKLKCGDVVFELFFYYKTQKYLKDALGTEMPKSEMDSINQFLEDYHGIKLYRDNFRVKPYGDNGNDWTGLSEAARNSPSMWPRDNAMLGMVHISKLKNPHIKDITTREGLILNDQVQDLITFVRIAVSEIFVNQRSVYESHKKKARKKKNAGGKIKSPEIVKVADVVKTNSPIVKFIDVKGDYPQNFYIKLEQEINDCHRTNFPNAVFLLSRKLIENLIYDVLVRKFPTRQKLWWNEQLGEHLNLSPLLKNLFENRHEFKPNSKRQIEKCHELGGVFRDESNKTTHNMYDYLDSKNDLDRFKVNDMIQLLINIHRNL